MEVDVTGWRDDVVLRELSVRTISMFGGSPLDVRAGCACFPWFLSFGIRTQNSRVAGARPNHQADRGSDPNGEFLKLDAEACIACNATSVIELALLGLAFPGQNPGETRVFDCNKRGPRDDTG
jgi:hypothetical protein